MKQMICLFLLCCLGFSATVFATTPKEGVDYRVVVPVTKQPVKVDRNQVEVIEFFSYACPACFQVESAVEKWKAHKLTGVVFRRVPVIFHDPWKLLAKTFYIAKEFEIEERLTPKLFRAIHQQRRDLLSEDKLATFVSKYGITKEDFLDAMRYSPNVDARMQLGKSLTETYQIAEVPTLVVGGKYQTNIAMVGGNVSRLIETLNYLITLSTPANTES